MHVAPEPKLGRMLRDRYGASYVSLDIDAARADVVADIIDLPFPDRTFDLVICAHVLEHVPDDRKAMREFARVLAANGTAILLVPFSPILERSFENPDVVEPADRERVFGQSDHVRIYGLDYTDRLKESGFDVDVVYPADLMSSGDVSRYALDPREPLFLCKKAA